MPKGCEASPQHPPVGLCATCERAAHCIYLRSSTRAIHECEEFALPEEAGPALAADRCQTRPAALPLPAAQGSATTPLLGLCVNCNQLAQCTYPRPEGGVWSCEEYS